MPKKSMVPLDDAPALFADRIAADPTNAGLHALSAGLHRLGKPDDALADYGRAIELAPKTAAWRNNRALVHAARKDYAKALADYDAAIELAPSDALAFRNRAAVWQAKKDYAQAAADYGRAVELAPDVAFAQNALGWLRATAPDAKVRDGKKGRLAAARKACELTDFKSGTYLDTLAAAHAEAGDFAAAVEWQGRALEAPDFPKSDLDNGKKRLQLFKDKTPYRFDD